MLGWSDRAIRRSGLALLLLVAVGGPSALFANLVPDDGPAPDPAVVEDRDRLEAIRERLDRRSAQKRHVERQVEALATQVDAIQAQRERRTRALDADLGEVARLERELDRLVPRLLISRRQSADLERTSARTLATIASLSRATIAPEMRARLRAISPVMLRRLQTRGSGLAPLEARAQQLIDRHRHLRESLPTTMADRLRLEMQREQTARQQAAAERKLRTMAAALERLAREEAVMGRRVLRAEQAQAAVVSITPERAGRAPLLKAWRGGADFEARLGKPRLHGRLPVAVRPAQAYGTARVVAAALDPSAGPGAEPSAGPAVWPPPPAKPSELFGRAQIATRSEHAASGNGRSAFSASIERSVKVRRPSRPIVPSPDALLDPVLQAVDQRPVITMPARPGQEVAAPDAGRVAFGGGFGSYGLLLILEHERDYHTILWGFSKLNVATDDHVKAGDIIGVMGDGDRSSELRVEFRRNGRPVGILPWLAASSSKVRG